jgi:hypothetical protein
MHLLPRCAPIVAALGTAQHIFATRFIINNAKDSGDTIKRTDAARAVQKLLGIRNHPKFQKLEKTDVFSRTSPSHVKSPVLN